MKKRALLIGLLSATTLVSARQDMNKMPEAPKEMAVLKEMAGTWSGEIAMFFGPEPMKSKTTMTSEMVMGGRFMESRFMIDMPGMGMMEGRQLITYNEKEKVYVSWWFDSMESDAMVQKGKLDGKKLVLESNPMEMPGMEGKQIFRSTYWGEGASSKFLMESKGSDAKWVKMMEGTFTKKK